MNSVHKLWQRGGLCLTNEWCLLLQTPTSTVPEPQTVLPKKQGLFGVRNCSSETKFRTRLAVLPPQDRKISCTFCTWNVLSGFKDTMFISWIVWKTFPAWLKTSMVSFCRWQQGDVMRARKLFINEPMKNQADFTQHLLVICWVLHRAPVQQS